MAKSKKDKKKIGVFVCHCGINIAKTVDVSEVVNFARTLPNVKCAQENRFMCSESGQEEIKKAISDKKLNRIVVASCSPRLHEHTFRAVISEAGLNPFNLEMANIRENVSWVHHEEPKEATEKAKHIVSGAVFRARNLEDIGTMTVPVTQAVLVIGGGVAGIQAALDAADMGFSVYLVEREPSIGGNMARLVETFPTNDCAMCILSPKMAEAARNPNIEILTYSEVTEVKGYVGNFQVTVVRKPRYIEEEKCVGCGDCEEKCPVSVDNEWDLGLGKRKAAYLQFPQALPRTYVIDPVNCIKLIKNKCGLCQKACPADAVEFKQKPRERHLDVGSIIVATGAREFNPSAVIPYGFDRYDDIVTQLQLARMMDPSGPTEGEILRPSDREKPSTYLMLQCVGSRDENHNPYCSRVCCMSAIKHALMIKSEQDPKALVYIAYQDIRSFGKGYEEYYKRACGEGIRFIRSRAAEITSTEDGVLSAVLDDVDSGELITLNPDLLVLSSGLVASRDAGELAKILRLETDSCNFFTERHPKLAPVDTKIEGIFVCGCAQGPKDIPDSVAQARAAAMGAVRAVSRESISIDLATAVVDEVLCNSCGICIEACPYEAIEEKDVSENSPGTGVTIIEVLCKSCGICAAECPTGAVELSHYKMNQMFNQIEGICRDVK